MAPMCQVAPNYRKHVHLPLSLPITAKHMQDVECVMGQEDESKVISQLRRKLVYTQAMESVTLSVRREAHSVFALGFPII